MAANIVKRNPSRSLTLMEPYYRPWSYLDELERFVDSAWESWRPDVMHSHRFDVFPRIDMYELEDELHVRAELPGLKKSEIDISLEGDHLVIKGEKKQEEVSEDANYYVCETNSGNFIRSVSLPFPVNSQKLAATFEDGVLDIRLPKAAEAKAKHVKIEAK